MTNQDPDKAPRIVGRIAELPSRRRRNAWDGIFDEIGKDTSGEYHVVQRPDGEPITTAPHLRKMFPDFEITTVGGTLYARRRAESNGQG